jgi:hypothetical protein
VDARQRWAARGGRVEDLRQAAIYGPWRFKREEDGDLYVHHEDGRDRAAGPTDRIWRERMGALAKPAPGSGEPRRRSQPTKVDGIYQHPPECGCWICADGAEAAG